MTDYALETENFIERLKETEVHKEFFRQKEYIKQFPELKGKIDAYRQENYRLQNEMDSDALFDEIDRFEQKYEEFRKDPVVSAFLASELAYCRMLQEISDQITAALAKGLE